MFESWTVVFVGLGYVGLLFAVATWGDRLARRGGSLLPRPFIYAFSLGVYCTSWTYFGSVGVASRSGWDDMNRSYRAGSNRRRPSSRSSTQSA